MDNEKLQDALIALAEHLAANDELRTWFIGFESATASDRISAFGQIAERMKAAGEAEEIVAAVSSLVRTDAYRGMLQFLRENYAEG